MNQGSYRVIFQGIRDGVAPLEARTKLAALFKATPEQVNILLASANHVLKSGLDKDMARAYQNAIEAAGGACRLELDSPPQLDITLPADTVAEVASVQPAPQPGLISRIRGWINEAPMLLGGAAVLFAGLAALKGGTGIIPRALPQITINGPLQGVVEVRDCRWNYSLLQCNLVNTSDAPMDTHRLKFESNCFNDKGTKVDTRGFTPTINPHGSAEVILCSYEKHVAGKAVLGIRGQAELAENEAGDGSWTPPTSGIWQCDNASQGQRWETWTLYPDGHYAYLGEEGLAKGTGHYQWTDGNTLDVTDDGNPRLNQSWAILETRSHAWLMSNGRFTVYCHG